MEWRKNQFLIFIFGSLFQLVLLLSYYDGLDWKIEYHSALDILNRIPFYLQKNRVINGENIWNANHPPVFFYALALMMKIFGTSAISGRIMLWFFSNFVFLLLVEIISPENDREFIFLSLLYYLNPITCIVLVLAIFDLFLYVYILAGMYLFEEKKYALSSVFMAIGIVTKTIPILVLGILVCYLLLHKQVVPAIKMLLPAFIIVVGIYYSLYSQYGDLFLRKIYGFQLDRNTPNVSIWYAFLGYDINPDNFLVFQLSILSIGAIIAVKMMNSHWVSKYNSVSFIFALFSLTLRTYYTHYGIWYMLPMIPVLVFLFRTGKTREIVYVLINFCIFSLILVVCIFSCFDDPDPIRWMVQLHSLGHFLPTTGIIIFNLYLGMNWKKYLSNS